MSPLLANIYLHYVLDLWVQQWRNRGQRNKMNWKRMGRLEARWLPPVRWRHPWPEQRFYATIQDKNRMR